MDKRKTNGLNETLKAREAAAAEKERAARDTKVLALDDTERVKVLSPGRLVSKRFFRNKLALVGLAILIFMFLFAFIGPLLYPYSQTQIFYTFKPLNTDYASATERTEVVANSLDDSVTVPNAVLHRLNSYILDMQAADAAEKDVASPEGDEYLVTEHEEHIYTLSVYELTPVAVYSPRKQVAAYNRLSGAFDWKIKSLGAGFETLAMESVSGQKSSFTFEGESYSFNSTAKNQYAIVRDTPSINYVGSDPGEEFYAALQAAELSGFVYEDQYYVVSENEDGDYDVSIRGDSSPVLVASTYVFDAYDVSKSFSNEFRANALMAMTADGSFEADGQSYQIDESDDDIFVLDGAGEPLASLSTFVVRRYSGQDTLSIDFKQVTQDIIEEMEETKQLVRSFVYPLPEMDAEANYIRDENGNYSYVDTELTVSKKGGGGYVLTCEQITYLIDIYGAPSRQHLFGTDGDGMDILARMMYGGRISLMVGFVVVIMETILGVILGGIAGYFGRWVDTLIMRLVDIFYCIPTYPILIIMGAFFDAVKMNAYQRLMWLMVILGILGWAGIARLVRGQILSLREQEFMVAQEATGMRARRRIARHLVPNVMPQLIVNATMGLGAVIITESTLSFLGLGVKHPLATWGTMINSVTATSESMIRYTYIWIPVGLLICLTVIAFNFVGDGLRDAFDPKMKQ